MASLLTVYKALADESRLRLLRALLTGPFSVNELVEIVAMGQSRVSRHLKLLLDAGLVEVQREGTWAYYRAARRDGDDGIDTQLEVIRRHGQEVAAADADEARRLRTLERRRQRSRDFHQKVAPAWSRLRQELFGNGAVTQKILERVRGDTVADLGCGAGELLPELAKSCQRVIGVDSAPAMLEQAKKQVEAAHLDERVELRRGGLEHLPLADAELDCALLNMVVHHLADPPTVLGEVHRVLRPGGQLVLCELMRHGEEWMREAYGDLWLGFTQQEIEQLLVDAGLEILDSTHYKDTPRAGIVLAVARVPDKEG